MNLLDKMRKITPIAGLAGILSLNSGCVTGDPKTDALGNWLGNTLGGVLVAEAGRSEVNVNVDNGAGQGTRQENYQRQPQQVYVEKIEGVRSFYDNELGKFLIVGCNYFEDFDKNNVLELNKGEFRGVKEIFSNNERTMIYLGLAKFVPAGYIGFKLFGPDGNIIESAKTKVEGPGFGGSYQPGELKKGSYTMVFYKGNNQFIGKMDFEVFEK